MPCSGQVRPPNGAQRTGAQNREFVFRRVGGHGVSMPKSQEYLEYILEQLERFGGVTARRMFSGFGLYQHDVFFGLIFSDTLYFKVNDASRPDYESRGMRRFQPYKDKPHLSFTYYEVPVEVLEDREQLTLWATRSVQAAIATALEKQAKRRKPRAKGKKAKRATATRGKVKRGASIRPRTTSGAPASKQAKTAAKRPTARTGRR
jgi:DNA transformation protein